jgi:hypothetical protein
MKKQYIKDNHKVCTMCHENRHVSQYYVLRNANGRAYYQGMCIRCQTAYMSGYAASQRSFTNRAIKVLKASL